MGRLFGTDGVRGRANADLTPELALSVARAAAGVLADRGGTRRPVAVGEHTGGRAGHRQGQLRRQVGVGTTPDAVGPEEATHLRRRQRLEY